MRYRLESIQRRCWQTGVEACDQRWLSSPNIFSGTEVELTRELSELEAEFDRAVVFRGVPLDEVVFETDDEAEVCA